MEYSHYSLKDIEAKQLFIKNHIFSNETIEITEWKQFSLFTLFINIIINGQLHLNNNKNINTFTLLLN